MMTSLHPPPGTRPHDDDTTSSPQGKCRQDGVPTCSPQVNVLFMMSLHPPPGKCPHDDVTMFSPPGQCPHDDITTCSHPGIFCL